MTLDETFNPGESILRAEFKENFIRFCSFCCIIHNKKLNYPNIFLLIIKDKQINKIYKLMCDLTTDYEGIKMFLEIEPSIHKSKYVKKYLNQM